MNFGMERLDFINFTMFPSLLKLCSSLLLTFVDWFLKIEVLSGVTRNVWIGGKLGIKSYMWMNFSTFPLSVLLHSSSSSRTSFGNSTGFIGTMEKRFLIEAFLETGSYILHSLWISLLKISSLPILASLPFIPNRSSKLTLGLCACVERDLEAFRKAVSLSSYILQSISSDCESTASKPTFFKISTMNLFRTSSMGKNLNGNKSI